MATPIIRKVVALGALFLAVGCAHAKPSAVPHSEPDYDWSTFQGGTGGAADVASSPASSSSSSSASHGGSAGSSSPSSGGSSSGSTAPAPETTTSLDPSAGSGATDVAAAKPSDAQDASLPRKPSKSKIRGQSVSSVDAKVLANAAKTALKSKVVSSNVITGPQYEMVQVVLKDASVQIVRPASSPDSAGPKLRSPKVRKDSLTSLESGFYDSDSDVLVLVQTSKPGKSKRALGALLKK